MIRCLFILTNTLAFLGGTALIGLCAWIIVDAESIGIEANLITDKLQEILDDVYTQLNEIWEENVDIPEIFEEIFEWIGYATYIALSAGVLVAIISQDFQICIFFFKKNENILLISEKFGHFLMNLLFFRQF
ncbi:unnamed protein product [Oikopleura dioica]|uniref:Uncharacterized protein n=1 Tax=Oikopleura dioica TaxID=34765 RepID=E4YKU4_OIKDI|nr:unnamed protein product [Oikopleura dioica]